MLGKEIGRANKSEVGLLNCPFPKECPEFSDEKEINLLGKVTSFKAKYLYNSTCSWLFQSIANRYLAGIAYCLTVLVTMTILSFPGVLGTERTGCCHCLESKEVRWVRLDFRGTSVTLLLFAICWSFQTVIAVLLTWGSKDSKPHSFLTGESVYIAQCNYCQALLPFACHI